MDIGDKLYTEKYIITIVDFQDNNMIGITFDSRDARESNYNIVSIQLIEDHIVQKEWYYDNDPFKD